MSDAIKDLHFPKAGIDVSQAFSRQPNKQVFGGEYARTTAIASNVRGFESATGRLRGGTRSGLKRFVKGQVAGQYFVVQHLAVIVHTSEDAVA